MKISKITALTFAEILLAGAFLTACQSNEVTAENTKNQAANSVNSPEPLASPTPRNFSAAQLLTYLSANKTELAQMLKDTEIYVSGDVIAGGNDGGGTASFEFYDRIGRVHCSAYTSQIDAAKLNLLDKAVGDYLGKRSSRMPFVKAKGVYKEGFAPAAPPNNNWKIYLSNCSLIEVTP